jgi:ABC-type bacteriocin/lantibiotic exporter with double-glycine peptidase domain
MKITPRTVSLKEDEKRREKWENRKENAKEIWYAFLTGAKILSIILAVLAVVIGLVILMINFALWMIPVVIFIIFAILIGLVARNT